MMSLTKKKLQIIKSFLKGLRKTDRLIAAVSGALTEVICVDVGASYYPHTAWLFFLNSKKTKWVAVEPNNENLKYLESWAWPCEFQACTVGLSEYGGMQVLFKTNVDSGSSLLEPVVDPSMKHRIKNIDYFFPYEKINIETITLNKVIENTGSHGPVLVKLDTQGTELSILKGADNLFRSKRIVGIEMESTLLANPVMKGSGKFWQASEYLEAHGFELLHIKPISGVPIFGKSHSRAKIFLNECDAVFALRRDVVALLDIEYKACLWAFYLTYGFYEEACSFLQDDSSLKAHCLANGTDIFQVEQLLKSLM